MKITPIIKTIPFKSHNTNNDEDIKLGYDDTISQDARQLIRKWHETTYIPYQSIYEKEPRLTDYQLGQLLKPLTNKPKEIDINSMMGLPVYNVRPIGNGKSYRGSTLVRHEQCLPTLKKAGIEKIIDLVGYNSYEKKANDAGLEYYCPKFGEGIMGVWTEVIFDDYNQYARDYMKFIPYQKRSDESEIAKLKANYQLDLRRSIDNFVELIQELQKDYYYIGCEYGTDRTSAVLLLNNVFNPKFKDEDLPYCRNFEVDFMEQLYKNLTPQDKKRLGWDDEFDKNVPLKLKMLRD